MDYRTRSLLLASLAMVLPIAAPGRSCAGADRPGLVVAARAQTATEAGRSPAHLDPARAAAIVTAIRRADYEGDRAALARLHDELAGLQEESSLGSRLRYWRGFALWRRAQNGFNDGADPQDLEQDLMGAAREFEDAVRLDPGFVDARAGLISSLGLQAFLHRGDQARVQALVSQFGPLAREAAASAPDHPRLLWVLGPMRWYAPPDAPKVQIEERQAAAIASYERALAVIRKDRLSADPLEPSWGEPELLMSLAWSSLNRAVPDVSAAERYAREALALVPHWHYLRDLLLPQIERAAAPR